MSDPDVLQSASGQRSVSSDQAVDELFNTSSNGMVCHTESKLSHLCVHSIIIVLS